jgi:hypothetical protein
LVLEFELDHSPDVGFIIDDQDGLIVFQGSIPPWAA